MVMLSGKYSFELIFRWIRKVYPTIIKWKTKRLGFHGNNIFFFFFWDIFRHPFGSSLGNHLLRMEISFKRMSCPDASTKESIVFSPPPSSDSR